jgi:hypothetical protein
MSILVGAAGTFCALVLSGHAVDRLPIEARAKQSARAVAILLIVGVASFLQ